MRVATRMISCEVLATKVSGQHSRIEMPLDADAMVKASLGTFLGGRSKDSIRGIMRI